MYIWIKESDSFVGMSGISHGKDLSEVDNHIPDNELDSFFGVENIFDTLREMVNNYKFEDLNIFMKGIGWEEDPEMCTSNGYVIAHAYKKINKSKEFDVDLRKTFILENGQRIPTTFPQLKIDDIIQVEESTGEEVTIDGFNTFKIKSLPKKITNENHIIVWSVEVDLLDKYNIGIH